MTKLQTGSRIGGRVFFGCVSPITFDALPLMAEDNGDETGTLRVLLYAKSSVNGALTPVKVDPTTGALKVDASVSIDTIDIGAVDLQDGSGSPVIKGQAHMAGSLPVVLPDDQIVPATIHDSDYPLLNAVISIINSGDNIIITQPGANKKLRIYKVLIVSDLGVRTKVTYKSGSTAKSGAMDIDILSDDQLAGQYLECGTNEAFIINSSVSGQVSGYVLYRVVNV